jgi:hypothetical protein
MCYMAKYKSGLPGKGIWDKQNKEAWIDLAKQVNAAKNGVVTVTATRGPNAANAANSANAANARTAEVPVGGKPKRLTAYNMFTTEYIKNNPKAGFPPKGLWAGVSNEEKARYQALANAQKALHA